MDNKDTHISRRGVLKAGGGLAVAGLASALPAP